MEFAGDERGHKREKFVRREGKGTITGGRGRGRIGGDSWGREREKEIQEA